MAIASLILGILGLVAGIPFLLHFLLAVNITQNYLNWLESWWYGFLAYSFFYWPAGFISLIGLIFGVIAFVRQRKKQRKLTIIGIVFSALGSAVLITNLVVTIWLFTNI